MVCLFCLLLLVVVLCIYLEFAGCEFVGLNFSADLLIYLYFNFVLCLILLLCLIWFHFDVICVLIVVLRFALFCLTVVRFCFIVEFFVLLFGVTLLMSYLLGIRFWAFYCSFCINLDVSLILVVLYFSGCLGVDCGIGVCEVVLLFTLVGGFGFLC